MEKKQILPFLKKNYWVFVIIFIFFVALYLRGIPGTKLEYPKLQAIDPYFLFRMGEYIIENGDLPSNDYLAGYGTIPGGPDRHMDYQIVLWLYPSIFFILNPLFGVSWYWVGVWAPAIIASLQVVFMFLLTRELFNNTKAGLLAAAILAFMPGILYRSSAGFIEKEPVGAFFMLVSMWLFIKALKHKNNIIPSNWRQVLRHPISFINRASWEDERIVNVKTMIYGFLSGFFLFMMAGSWGGTRFVLIIFAAFVVLSLILNKYSKRLLTTYLTFFAAFLILTQLFTPYTISLASPEIIMNYFAILLLLFRYAIDRFNLVEKKYQPYVPVVFLVTATIFVFGAAYVLPEFGTWVNFNIIDRVSNPIAVGVIGSTVAEAQQGGEFLASAVNNFGTNTAIGYLGLSPYFLYLSIIYVAFIGVLIMAYEFIFRKRDESYIFALTFFFITMILSMGTVRLVFAFSFPVALLAGYALARGAEYVINRTNKWKDNWPTIMKGAVWSLIGLIIALNFVSGWVMANNIGSSVTDPWLDSMNWLREETPADAVLLQWWDYGWWFHYIAEKTTLVDGGYHPRTPTQDVAKFYTEPLSDKSMQFLQDYSVDYVMVSPDLISKFTAMSKIANWGSKVDALPIFQMTNQYQEGDKTLLEYTLGSDQILIAYSSVTNPDGSVGMGNITAIFKSVNGQAFIRDIGINNQVIRNDRPNAINGMAFFAGNAVIFVPEAVEECVFVRLYLFNGAGMEDYFEKQYDSRGMKIYRVRYENPQSKIVE